MIHRALLVAAATSLCLPILITSAPAAAQTLSDAWEVIGTVEAVLDDAPVRMVSARRLDTGEATALRQITENGQVISIGAMTVDEAGEPGLPILTLKLGPFVGDLPDAVTIDLRDAEGVMMANEHSETDAVLTDISLSEDGALSFGFEAELMVMAPSADGGYTPLAGAVGHRTTGRFDGGLPPANIPPANIPPAETPPGETLPGDAPVEAAPGEE
jgi:hypothetical protein